MTTAQPKKILVRSPNWIGDQILAYPFFYYLRRIHPESEISVVCGQYVSALQYRKQVDRVFVLPRPYRPDWKGKLQALEEGAKEIRAAGKFDLGISLPNSFSAAWLLYRSKALIRRGFRGDARSFLLNEPIDWNSREVHHRAESYLELLPKGESRPLVGAKDFWGHPPENPDDPADEGVKGVCESFAGDQEWPDCEPVTPPKEPYWVLAPGSAANSRRWSLQNFMDLALTISQETGMMGLVVGGPSEATAAARLCDDEHTNLRDLTGQGSAASYWKIFKNAQFTVANDSGLAHVAALCGSPVQVIWGAGNPKRTEPLGPGKVKLIFQPIDCWPCERNECSQPLELKYQCLKSIQPEIVWKEILSGIRPRITHKKS